MAPGVMPAAASPLAMSRVTPPIAHATIDHSFSTLDHQEHGGFSAPCLAPPAVLSGGSASRASAGSETSEERDAAAGTAELLLLQRGATNNNSAAAGTQVLPSSVLPPSSSPNHADVMEVRSGAMEASAELLMLNKRPRV